MNRIGTVYGQGLYALAKEESLEEEILQQLQTLQTAFAERLRKQPIKTLQNRKLRKTQKRFSAFPQKRLSE